MEASLNNPSSTTPPDDSATAALGYPTIPEITGLPFSPNKVPCVWNDILLLLAGLSSLKDRIVVLTAVAKIYSPKPDTPPDIRYWALGTYISDIFKLFNFNSLVSNIFYTYILYAS